MPWFWGNPLGSGSCARPDDGILERNLLFACGFSVKVEFSSFVRQPRTKVLEIPLGVHVRVGTPVGNVWIMLKPEGGQAISGIHSNASYRSCF